MSNKSTLKFFVVLLVSAFASAALVLADASALGQNANSSTTTGDSAQNDNANMSAPRRGRRGRRGRRPAAAATDANANTTDANANTTMEPGTTPETSGATGGQTEDISGERVDLSGTYTGNLSTTGGQDVGSGPATLTITGNTFDLSTEGGAKHGGRIYAVLTRGETSAALYFSDVTDPATNLTAVYNVRARKRGDSLRLWPAPFTKARLTFSAGGGTRRGRRGRARAGAADTTTTTMTGDTTAPAAETTTGAGATGAGAGTDTTRSRRGGRRSRRGRGTTNTNANSNTGDNTNTTPPR